MAQLGKAICSNCAAPITLESASCAYCGSKIKTTSNQPPPMNKRTPAIKAAWVIGAAVILFVVVKAIVWIANGGLYKDNSGPTGSVDQRSTANPSLPTGSSIAVGTNITLDGSNPDPTLSMKEITVAVSEFYLDQYLEAIQKNDILGTVEMVQNGQIFHVPSGTHGLLLEMKPPKAKVRIYGPPDDRKNWKYFGQAGWVLSPMVKAK